jgi:hypothetical protein
VKWVGITWWEMKGGDETKELNTNNITNRILDYGHKRCKHNESKKYTLYLKENYEFYFTQEKDVGRRNVKKRMDRRRF